MANVRGILRLCVAISAGLAAAQAAMGQQSPRIGYVYPAGGKQGTTFEVTIGGQFLPAPSGAVVSGQGVQVKLVEFERPMSQLQVDELRKEMTDLRAKRQAWTQARQRRPATGTSQPATRPWTDDDETRMREIAEKIAAFTRARAVPALSNIVTLKVTIDQDAQPGKRELRLKTAAGLTNPLVFFVGQLPEFAKKPNKGGDAFGISNDPAFGQFLRTAPPADTDVMLPILLNGQIAPGEVDRYRFGAKKGQKVVIAAQARALIPYMADAVPGWFQAMLTIRDDKGSELASADHYQFDPDPVLLFEAPADGTYTLEIRDAIYRGREDFVYRVSVGQLPFVTSAFPLGGHAGSQATVQLEGWNLSKAAFVMDCTGKEPGVCVLPMAGTDAPINAVQFAVGDLPEVFEKEPNNDISKAQAVELGSVINGRIDKPGDWDVLSFKGRGGQKIVAEVHARRLGSPLDSAIKLTDSSGKQLAYNDDYVDKSQGLLTHQADSCVVAQLPADGTYFVHITDIQHKGGPQYAYRLRVAPAGGDFELRISPSGANTRTGQSVVLTATAIRKEGFAGQIALSLKDAPRGFSISGATIPAGRDSVRFMLAIDREVPLGPPVDLHFAGKAMLDGREIVREAVPAENMMQAFAYWHLVPASTFEVWLQAKGWSQPARIVSPLPVKIEPGKTATVEVAIPPGTQFTDFGCTLTEPPDGIEVQKVITTRRGLDIVLRCNAAKAKPGPQDNLIATMTGIRTPTTAAASQPAQRRNPLGMLPAIPIEIVPPPQTTKP